MHVSTPEEQKENQWETYALTGRNARFRSEFHIQIYQQTKCSVNSFETTSKNNEGQRKPCRDFGQDQMVKFLF